MEQVGAETLGLVIVGFLTMVSPLAIAYIKRASWSTYLKVAVPVIVSLWLAIMFLWMTGGLDRGNLFPTTLAVYGLQQFAYTTIMRWWASMLEKVNDPGRHEFVTEAGDSVN